MFGKRKRTAAPLLSFDSENQQAVIKCSICNGEQVAGFKDKKTGQFTEVMLIRNQEDFKQFQALCGGARVMKEY